MTISRQQYIELYAESAMEQMRKYGIPASITLAQGIIESAEGKSMLSRTANNHFGVKGEFNGQFVRADDDKPNEKFKKYDNVGQSYEDHSKVLMADRTPGTSLPMTTKDGLLASRLVVMLPPRTMSAPSLESLKGQTCRNMTRW